jgi:hypothetical protein
MASTDYTRWLASLPADERAAIESVVAERNASGRAVGSQLGTRRGAPLTERQRAGVA